MRALWCTHWCDYDELTVEDVPEPVLRPGTVRIRVEAAGVSFSTQIVVSGKYQRKPPLPFAPGTDVAGIIVEVADDVTGLAPGMRVFAAVDWGGTAQEVVADAIHVMPLPEPLDLAASVALPISYSTAAAALMWRARLEPDRWALVQGAGGGVGLAAVEIARALGARVIARAGKNKRPPIEARGAEAILDSAAPFKDEVLRISGGGVQAVLDPLGGAAFDESLRCLADGGTLVTVGYVTGTIPQVGANILMLKNIAVAGLNWGNYIGWSPGDNREMHAPRVRAMWERLVGWWREGRIAPTVHARFPLSQFREAMAEVRSRRAVGRVVILPHA